MVHSVHHAILVCKQIQIKFTCKLKLHDEYLRRCFAYGIKPSGFF